MKTASAFASASAAALAAVLAAGCAAAPQIPTASLIETGQTVAACKRIAGVGGYYNEASEIHTAREHAKLLAQQYRITVSLSVQTLDAANEALGRPLLRGEITPLEISVLSEGPQLYGLFIDVIAYEDGARWETIVKQQTLHDTLRSLFGARGEKLPPADERTTHHGWGRRYSSEDWKLAEQSLEFRSVGCRHLSIEPCTQLVPLARVAPSVGADELLFEVALWIKDATDDCMFQQIYSVALPPGASLTERLSALAARGPLVLGHSSGQTDAPPPIQ